MPATQKTNDPQPNNHGFYMSAPSNSITQLNDQIGAMKHEIDNLKKIIQQQHTNIKMILMVLDNHYLSPETLNRLKKLMIIEN